MHVWNIYFLAFVLLASTAVLSTMFAHRMFGAAMPSRAHRLRRWNQRRARED